ncbi:uncharacterized protein LOC110442313 [Mizuhopecten yessoensis]|uniref:Protein SPEC3 n=1 Tax=Mizuhopecten yessoensis TaxID=6573 RepID=A0A210PHH3_MIZYE|nr:uncharacterized protein LOC110442313 [Mizuhopecten yessoensis]XP_021341521.1 uncharacterized protein LOC110442313 [Mizuhopecten yessoensis]XP_021341522.1 uncharacterized protein LOC110442313 [Mizuhopecten yessoensis]OWF35944.1 Protein SPEC3 [Mizuhopecten yessoensis]
MSSGTKSGSSTERSTDGKRAVPEGKPNNGLFNRQKSKGRLFKSTKPGSIGNWNSVKSVGFKKKGKSSPTIQEDKDTKTGTESIIDIEVEDVTVAESVDQVNSTDKDSSEINTEADNIKNDNLEKGKGNPNVVVEKNNENSEAKTSSETVIPNGDASKLNGHVFGKPVASNGIAPVLNGVPAKKENSFFREKSTLAPPKTPISKKERTESPDSKKSFTRRDSSKLSLDGSSRVSVDAALQTAGVVYPTEDKPQKSVFSNNDSWIRSAIPSLPLWFAITCLVLNILIPGSGTILSGCSILCCGKSRVQAKDDQLTVTLCVNIMVGIAQLFTVTFLFVGWFWSLAWGLKMVSIAVEYRHQKKQQRERELQTLALSAFGSPSRVRSLFSAV